MSVDLEIVSLGTPPVLGVTIGSISNTLAGHIDPQLRQHRFQAADYSFGFETASPKDFSSLGESVLVNGLCYTTSTDENSEHGQVIAGREFVTGGMFLLPKEVKPTHRLVLNAPMTFEQLCTSIYTILRHPVAFVGFWECEELYGMVIAQPPIHGRPIFENRDYYFSHSHPLLKGVRCFVMGIITSFCDKQWETVNKQLEVALYNNPYDQQVLLSSHTHGLVLKQEVSHIEQITPALVERCLHFFVDKTRIKKAHLDLYALEGVDRFCA